MHIRKQQHIFGNQNCLDAIKLYHEEPTALHPQKDILSMKECMFIHHAKKPLWMNIFVLATKIASMPLNYIMKNPALHTQQVDFQLTKVGSKLELYTHLLTPANSPVNQFMTIDLRLTKTKNKEIKLNKYTRWGRWR